uniref:phosphopantothenoylcysteine decarboxylase domain-containing protein n=1 Tax=Bacillus paralicheniformis TaxID=1648923 RepID=UPI0023679F98
DMYQAALSVFDESDIVIKTAAVADYRSPDLQQQLIQNEQGENKVNGSNSGSSNSSASSSSAQTGTSETAQ